MARFESEKKTSYERTERERKRSLENKTAYLNLEGRTDYNSLPHYSVSRGIWMAHLSAESLAAHYAKDAAKADEFICEVLNEISSLTAAIDKIGGK